MVDGKIPGRRRISLRTYFKGSEEERSITLINLFKKEDKGAVDQLDSVLMELTLTTDPKKIPRDFILGQRLMVYKRTYEQWVTHLTNMMIACNDCDRPTWGS